MESTTSSPGPSAPKVMRLRYAGTCDLCQTPLEAGTRAGYLQASKTVRCLSCIATAEDDEPGPAASPPPVEPGPPAAGSAGSSARREYERRSAKREARIREAHPRLGGLILAVTDEPQSTTAWARGAKGEELLGRRLDGLAAEGVRLLHDRRIPGTRANIDHVAVSATGVHVIDAKRYRGRPSLRVEGGLFRPRSEKLLVGSRDCTKLVEGVHKQVTLVRAALDSAGLADAPVHGALCFVEADWPVLGGSFVVDDVAVLWPKKLAERLTRAGGWTIAEIDHVHATLATAFPQA